MRSAAASLCRSAASRWHAGTTPAACGWARDGARRSSSTAAGPAPPSPAAAAPALAAASAGPAPVACVTAGLLQDRIVLKGLAFYGRHGVLAEERTLGQKFLVDVTLSTSLRKAGKSDDLADSVDYAAVYDDVRCIVEGPPLQLIEAVAERIAARVLARHARVDNIAVAVSKPHVAVPGIVEALGVEIVRERAPA